MCQKLFALIFLGILSQGHFLQAASSTTQVVTMEIDAVNEISISGSAPTLTIDAATPGSGPTSVSSSGITYSITTNESDKKITGSIDSNMPTGTTLTANLGAPTGATSAGAVSLSTTDADLVTAISTLSETGKTLTYNFSATAAAGTLASFTRTVTFSIVDGS